MNYLQLPYYVNVLPKILREAVIEVHESTGAPYALVLNSALASLSSAAQGHFNVTRPGGLVGPTALFLLTIAESGERKTTIDGMFTKPLREFEREQRSLALVEESIYRAKQERWSAELRGIRRNIEKDAADGINNHDAVEKQLVNLMDREPVKPPTRKTIYEDATPAALKAGLAEWPSAVVLSDEGAKVMNGFIFSEPGLLNALWSGSDLQVDRRGSGAVTTKDPRLTISVMVQPGIFEKFNAQKGESFRDIGMFARFLIAKPFSTQGWRHSDGLEPSREKLEVFHDRVREILQISTSARINAGEAHEYTCIKMSPEASEVWLRDGLNRVESMIAPGGAFFSIRDFAAKIGDQAARIAALLHLLSDDGHCEISIDTMLKAISLMRHFESEFLNIFGQKPEQPEHIRDAIILFKWLEDQLWSRGVAWVFKNQIRQRCPSALRKNGRFQRALDYLISSGFLCFSFVQSENGRSTKTFVYPVLPAPIFNGALGSFMDIYEAK